MNGCKQLWMERAEREQHSTHRAKTVHVKVSIYNYLYTSNQTQTTNNIIIILTNDLVIFIPNYYIIFHSNTNTEICCPYLCMDEWSRTLSLSLSLVCARSFVIWWTCVDLNVNGLSRFEAFFRFNILLIRVLWLTSWLAHIQLRQRLLLLHALNCGRWLVLKDLFYSETTRWYWWCVYVDIVAVAVPIILCVQLICTCNIDIRGFLSIQQQQQSNSSRHHHHLLGGVLCQPAAQAVPPFVLSTSWWWWWCWSLLLLVV